MDRSKRVFVGPIIRIRPPVFFSQSVKPETRSPSVGSGLSYRAVLFSFKRYFIRLPINQRLDFLCVCVCVCQGGPNVVADMTTVDVTTDVNTDESVWNSDVPDATATWTTSSATSARLTETTRTSTVAAAATESNTTPTPTTMTKKTTTTTTTTTTTAGATSATSTTSTSTSPATVTPKTGPVPSTTWHFEVRKVDCDTCLQKLVLKSSTAFKKRSMRIRFCSSSARIHREGREPITMNRVRPTSRTSSTSQSVLQVGRGLFFSVFFFRFA